MYPRMNLYFHPEEFFGLVVSVVSGCGVNLRTEIMAVVYAQLKYMLEAFYLEVGGRLMEGPELVPGASCIVVKNFTVYRGEIIYMDEQGYTEVWLVDIGESDFFWSFSLYSPEPYFALMPALLIECELRGMEGLRDDEGAREALELVCLGLQGVQGRVLSRDCGMGVLRVRLRDMNDVDIGRIVHTILDLEDTVYDADDPDDGVGEEVEE